MTAISHVEPEPSVLERRLVDEGQLVDGATGSLSVAELANRLAERIAEHLERVAWWPDHEHRFSGRLGEFSSYSIGFKCRDFRTLYVRVETEPWREATLEISSSVEDPALAATAPEAMKEALLRRGFRAGGGRGGFLRAQRLQSAEDCRAAADAIAGLMTDCLGYDATRPVSFKFDLHQRLQSEPVLHSISVGDLARLLRADGLVIWPLRSAAGRPGFRTVDYPRFELYPYLESAGDPGSYRGLLFLFSAQFTPEAAAAAVTDFRNWYARGEIRATADGLVEIRQVVAISGGVTETFLRLQLNIWREILKYAMALGRSAAEDGDD